MNIHINQVEEGHNRHHHYLIRSSLHDLHDQFTDFAQAVPGSLLIYTRLLFHLLHHFCQLVSLP